MNKVVTVNLNGNAYQLEEGGYEVLRQYLDRAGAQLKDNPDKAEIMADLEQAIAEKCASFLSSHKNVVSADEVAQILRQMGPVDTGAAEAANAQASAQSTPRSGSSNAGAAAKRLYRIRDGAMIAGVCKGIAAYFDVDVTIVRVAFVFLALVTGGGLVLGYIVMMFVIPCANTGEERAAAYGAPFNAQEVIDQAKKHYAEFKNEFKDRKEWRRHWRQQRKAWKRRWREESYWWGDNVQRSAHNVVNSFGYASQVLAGVMVPILGIASAILFCAWIVALVSVASTNAIFGWPLPDTMPLWVGILILFLVYNAIAWPLRHARRAAYYASGGNSYAWFSAWDGILSLGFTILVFWLAYQYIPEVHHFVQHFPESWDSLWNNLTNSFHHRPSGKPPEIEHSAWFL